MKNKTSLTIDANQLPVVSEEVKKKVDDIWAEMKGSSAPQPKPSASQVATKSVSSASVPTSTTSTSTVGVKRPLEEPSSSGEAAVKKVGVCKQQSAT